MTYIQRRIGEAQARRFITSLMGDITTVVLDRYLGRVRLTYTYAENDEASYEYVPPATLPASEVDKIANAIINALGMSGVLGEPGDTYVSQLDIQALTAGLQAGMVGLLAPGQVHSPPSLNPPSFTPHLCRNGIHTLEAPGPCDECRHAKQRRADERQRTNGNAMVRNDRYRARKRRKDNGLPWEETFPLLSN